MSNAFTKKPDLGKFVRDLELNRVKASVASESAQKRNHTKSNTLRPYSRDERRGKQ